MTTWTPPITWTVGQIVTAAQLNQQVRDNENYLQQGHEVKVFRTVDTPNITTATKTLVAFDNESYDTDGFHNNAVNNTRLTVPTGFDGYYIAQLRLFYTADATGIRRAYITKNGTTDLDQDVSSNLGAGQAASCKATASVSLVAGDYLEAFGYHTNGGNLTIVGSLSTCWFSMSYRGAP